MLNNYHSLAFLIATKLMYNRPPTLIVYDFFPHSSIQERRVIEVFWNEIFAAICNKKPIFGSFRTLKCWICVGVGLHMFWSVLRQVRSPGNPVIGVSIPHSNRFAFLAIPRNSSIKYSSKASTHVERSVTPVFTLFRYDLNARYLRGSCK
jgi:hypothetical protein